MPNQSNQSLKLISSFLREFRDIFISGSKTGNKVLFFFIEAIFFLIISVVTGLIISYPIYYWGATPKFTESYKIVVSLGLVLLIISFFVYRFVKGFKEEWQVIKSSSVFSDNRKLIICFIYSAPLLLPKWIKTLSYVVFGVFIISFTILLVGNFIFSFLVSPEDLLSENTSLIKETYNIINKFLNFYLNIIYENIFYTILFIFELVILMSFFNGKLVLEKNQKSIFGFWYFAFASIQFSLLYFFFYFMALYKIIALF
ncbi:MAG: hypothetical protein OEV44_02705 [Spirochaetota bacterium]|nr:hypothetical protein [Spirochaetota bacterium]